MKKVLYLCFMLTMGLAFQSCQDAQAGKRQAGEEKEISTDDEASKGYQIGDIVADFSLENIDGQMISMANYPEAKGFIIIFTCNTCPYAVEYEDRIIELDKKYSANGYQLIAINPNDPEVKPGDSMEAMKERALEKGFEFPYVFDAGQKVYPVFGATKTPHVFILDKDKRVKYIGAIDDNHQDANEVEERFVENAIASIEKGENPDPSTTKAIGCTIKVK